LKTLYIVRHAKSSWKDSGIADVDRPLNKRGNRDAPFMGNLLFQKGISPDVMFSSPANRAITTAEAFATQLNYPQESIIIDKNIYEAGIGSLLRTINNVGNENSSAMLFGHNPGLTMLSNYLSDKYIDNIPTCAVVGIYLDITKWVDAADKCGKLDIFEYPKKYFKK